VDIHIEGSHPKALDAALRAACLLECEKTGGVLLHAAGLLFGDIALIALAPSGGGKSTLTSLAEGCLSLSDETVLIEEDGSAYVARGTSFRSSSNKPPQLRSARLAAFLILEKSQIPSYSRASSFDLLRQLSTQAYRLGDRPTEAFHRCRKLAESVPAFLFRFPKNCSANELLASLANELGAQH
jgi:hypothetical protein